MTQDHDFILIKDATENNLKHVTVKIPKRQITVVTGVSGSGKSSLVLDTIAAKSRRDLAAMVSNTNDDFPEPETPVTTVICRLGISTVTCFRLFSVASLMRIWSKLMGINAFFLSCKGKNFLFLPPYEI